MSAHSFTADGEIAFEVQYVSDEMASGTMLVQDGILNPFGTVHAGAMIWFADVIATTLALQGNTPTSGMTGFPLAINLTANLLSNCREGKLHATAGFVKKGRRISTIRTIVNSDKGKQLLDLTTTHFAA